MIMIEEKQQNNLTFQSSLSSSNDKKKKTETMLSNNNLFKSSFVCHNEIKDKHFDDDDDEDDFFKMKINNNHKIYERHKSLPSLISSSIINNNNTIDKLFHYNDQLIKRLISFYLFILIPIPLLLLLRTNRHHHHNRHKLTSVFNRFHQKYSIVLLILIIILIFPTLTLSSECRFPEHWWGSWFQKGVSDTIYISRNNISEKGLCRKNNGEKYLIENRNEKCVRCLVISERHTNILQYKETSSCYPLTESTFEICFDINGDAPLYSLFRVNTSPIKCPFKGPFTFSYSKGIYRNECKDPLSTIDECTDDRHMLFKFRACIDISGSESKVEKLECIADWREGSNRYLVGKLYHQLARTDEDQFRCFVIEKNNSDPIESYNIGQSGDASCEGLFTPRDGARTFKLRKSDQIKPLCDFPQWLTESIRWTTLDNRYVYDFSALNQFNVVDVKNEISRTSKCIRSEEFSPSSASSSLPSLSSSSSSSASSPSSRLLSSSSLQFNTSRFIIHTTLQCSSGFACMYAYQREDRIIELQIGNIVSDASDACLSINSNVRPTKFITLTTMDQETRPCELSGIYSIRTKMPYSYNSNNYNNNNNNRNVTYSRLVSLLDSRFMCQEKALKLKSNCDEPNLFQFICTTDNRVKNFYCRGGWRENSTQYILVSLKDKFNYEYCIAYNIDSQEIRLIRNSHFCYRNDNDPMATMMMMSQEWQAFRPSSPGSGPGGGPGIDQNHYHKYAAKYDDSVSFTLINEGSCQRSGSISTTLVSHFRFDHHHHHHYMIIFMFNLLIWLLFL